MHLGSALVAVKGNAVQSKKFTHSQINLVIGFAKQLWVLSVFILIHFSAVNVFIDEKGDLANEAYYREYKRVNAKFPFLTFASFAFLASFAYFELDVFISKFVEQMHIEILDIRVFPLFRRLLSQLKFLIS